MLITNYRVKLGKETLGLGQQRVSGSRTHSSHHHHEARGSSLWESSSQSRPEVSSLEGVLLAVNLSIKLEVIVSKDEMALL